MTPRAITQLLATMTDDLAALAITWHLAIAVAIVAIAAGWWRPSRRVAGLLLVLPVLSVALVATSYGNMFNAASFLALALMMGVIADGLAPVRAERSSAWTSWLGAALIAYGVVYPHFVDGGWDRAIIAAPIGVIPCPTLAFVCGVTLVADGLSSRALPALLALWSTFYALFGVFALGVRIDIALLAAPASMVALLCMPRTRDRECSPTRREPVHS